MRWRCARDRNNYRSSNVTQLASLRIASFAPRTSSTLFSTVYCIRRLEMVLLMLLVNAGLRRSASCVEAHQEGAGSSDSRKNELRAWREDRYIKCLFCMDYDDYEHLSVFGCNAADLPTCYGNACYMRQHKDDKFFLYTSGCLNITQKDYAGICERTMNIRPMRGKHGNETQLCEVTMTINTCLCTNRNACNNISSVDPFSEFTQFIFKETKFDEVAHFRHFLPHDPILKNPEMAILRRNGKNTADQQYILLSRSSAAGSPARIYTRRYSARRKRWGVDTVRALAAILSLSFYVILFFI